MTHDELLAKIDEPNPIMVYETEAQMKLLKQKEVYLLSTFQFLGINPNVLIEQNTLITELKAQISAVVELKESKHPESELFDDHYFYDLGYNQALADVRQAIEKESK